AAHEGHLGREARGVALGLHRSGDEAGVENLDHVYFFFVGSGEALSARADLPVRSADQWSMALSDSTKLNGLREGDEASWQLRHCFSEGSTRPTSRASSASFITYEAA